MGIIRKLYDKGEKTVNDIKSKYQNPLREFEKELKNLKLYLKESKSLAAHINALKIRAEKDTVDHKEQINKYQKKAEDAIKRNKSKEISDDIAEKISVSALKLKKTYENRVLELTDNIPKYDEELKLVKEKISDLLLKIEYYENEYRFLKTSSKKNINNPDRNIFYSDSGIISRLEKLKEVILNQTIKSDFFSKKSDDLYKDVDIDDVYDEYKELKTKIKK